MTEQELKRHIEHEAFVDVKVVELEEGGYWATAYDKDEWPSRMTANQLDYTIAGALQKVAQQLKVAL